MPGPAHMSHDEFRRRGEQLLRQIASYHERLEHLPVLSAAAPGEIYESVPDDPPERGESWDAILGDALGPGGLIERGLTHWQSPNFFGYFPANASYPAMLGELLSAGLGVQGMLWQTSPACTELETRMLDWMAALLGLPERFRFDSEPDGGAETGGGVIQGTASEATLVTMLAARAEAVKRAGGGSGRLTLYASTQAHSSVIKAAMIAGLARGPQDREHVRLIGTDEQLAMRPDLLERAVESDLAAGATPFYVCATVGTTSSTAVDPLDGIGEAARRHGLWLHADGAHALAACVCPEMRWMLRGAELCDSICFNPHKWLLTNFDCDCLWVARRGALIDALSVTPEYLRNAPSEAGTVIDYRDWQIPLGRRFRALKLWFVIRHYGVEGLRAHVREGVRLAAMFEHMVREDDRFELCAPRTVNLVCFRLTGPEADARNRDLLDRLNASGRIFLTHTVLEDPDRFVLRMAIGGTWTAERHVRRAWELIQQTAAEVLSSA